MTGIPPVFNPNVYRTNLNKMKESLQAPKKPLLDEITDLSINSHVPIVAVLAFALRPDICGPRDDLSNLLHVCIKFYKLEGVEPWEDL